MQETTAHGAGGGPIATNPLTPLPSGETYEMPYCCLLPRGVEGLLIAGRCMSGTHEAHGSYRVMATCMATGQAAGTAAALAVSSRKTPRELAPTRILATLQEQGVLLTKDAHV